MNYCELCYRDAKYFGELFAEHDLILFEGHYMICDGHDEIFRFQGLPLKDPCKGLNDDQIEALLKTTEGWEADRAYSNFVEEFRVNNFQLHPMLGHRIVELCKQAGYNSETDGWLEYWIIHRAANLVEASQI